MGDKKEVNRRAFPSFQKLGCEGKGIDRALAQWGCADRERVLCMEESCADVHATL